MYSCIFEEVGAEGRVWINIVRESCEGKGDGCIGSIAFSAFSKTKQTGIRSNDLVQLSQNKNQPYPFLSLVILIPEQSEGGPGKSGVGLG